MFSKMYILRICIYMYTKAFLLHLIKTEDRTSKKKKREKLGNIN